MKPWEKFAQPAPARASKPWERFAAERAIAEESEAEMQRLANRSALRQQELTNNKVESYRRESQRGKPIGRVEEFLGGVTRAWDRAAFGLKGLFTDLTPEDKERLEAGRAFVDNTGALSTVGEVAGDVLLTAPAALRGAQVVGGLVKGSGLLRSVGRGAGVVLADAGIGAAVSPENRAEGAQYGAIGSAIGQGAARVAGGALRPAVTDDARRLIDRGVLPTPGQAVGGVGNRLEQKAMSVPLVGDVIGNARSRANREFNAAAIKSVGPQSANPTSSALPYGDEAVLALGRDIGRYYDAILDFMGPVRIGPDFEQRVLQGVLNPELLIDQRVQSRVLKEVDELILQRAQGGALDPQTAKQIDSILGRKAANLRGSPNPADRDLGSAYSAVQDALRQAITDSDQIAGAALQDANRAYRQFKVLDDAASSAQGQNIHSAANAGETRGVFTPQVLRRALRKADKTMGDHALRSGNAGALTQLNRLADLGERVLGNNVPDSGTAGRLFLPGALAGWAFAPGSFATAAGGAAAAAGAYTRLGTAALLGETGVQRGVRRWIPPSLRNLSGAAGASGMRTEKVQPAEGYGEAAVPLPNPLRAAAEAVEASIGSVPLPNPLRAAAEAVEASIASGLPGLDGGQQDALRHSVWVGLLQRDIADLLGDSEAANQIAIVLAQQPGFLNELLGLPGDLYGRGLQGAVRSILQDLNSNAVGARAGAQFKDKVRLKQALEAQARAAEPGRGIQPNLYTTR